MKKLSWHHRYLAYQMALSDGKPVPATASERDVITDAPDSEPSVCSKTLAGLRSNGETTALHRWSVSAYPGKLQCI